MPSGWEWAVLVLIGLLLLGGSRLSGIGANVGKAVREFKQEAAGADRKHRPDSATSPSAAVRVTQVDAAPADDEDIVEAELVEPVEPETKPERA